MQASLQLSGTVPAYRYRATVCPVLRIRDVYPRSRFFSIQDPESWILGPTTTKKEGGGGEFGVERVFVSINFPKLKTIFNFEQVKKKNLSQGTKNLSIFSQKLLLTSQKYGLGIGDPEKNLSWIPDPEVIKAQNQDPQHCHTVSNKLLDTNFHFEISYSINRFCTKKVPVVKKTSLNKVPVTICLHVMKVRNPAICINDNALFFKFFKMFLFF